MAVLQQTFDPSTVEDSGFGAVPAGTYRARVIESDEKANKRGTGRILVLVFQFETGKAKGLRWYCNLNYQHDNPTAQKIAQEHLKAITEAAGIPALQNSEQLHGKPILLTVKVKSDPGFGDKNEFVKAASIGRTSQPTAQQPAQTQPEPGADLDADGEAPWNNNMDDEVPF